MHTLRTRFAKDIVTEFLPPSRPSHRVIIFLDGMPTVPAKKALLEFFAKKGYWVFHPRYRGTWESGGSFLRESPEQDIRDVINGLSKKFKSLWDGKPYSVRPSKIYVMGSSFGGAGALLAASHPHVTAVIALSPVVDWRVRSKTEPLATMKRLIHTAFGEAYRFHEKDWVIFAEGRLYNPTLRTSFINGAKVHIIHAKDDNIVPWKSIAAFAQKTRSNLRMMSKGGHLSLSQLTEPQFYTYIKKIL